jgi:hypothetical protein
MRSNPAAVVRDVDSFSVRVAVCRIQLGKKRRAGRVASLRNIRAVARHARLQQDPVVICSVLESVHVAVIRARRAREIQGYAPVAHFQRTSLVVYREDAVAVSEQRCRQLSQEISPRHLSNIAIIVILKIDRCWRKIILTT